MCEIKVEADPADRQEGWGRGEWAWWGDLDEVYCFVPFWIVYGLKCMSAFGSVRRV